MRHKYNQLLQMNTWDQKATLIIRNLMTSLVKYWQIKTTAKRAKVLKSEMDKFFSRLVSLFDKYTDEKDVRREAIRYVKTLIFTEEEWKKVVNDLLPKYKDKGIKSWFIQDFKLGARPWDNAEVVLIKLI